MVHHHPQNADTTARLEESFEGRWGDGVGLAHVDMTFQDEDDQADTQTSPRTKQITFRKPRLSKATRSSLHHKQLLKSRKRQLVAVLGAMYNGDSFALEQALSSAQPFAKSEIYGGSKQFRIRPSGRRNKAFARRFLRARLKADVAKQPDLGQMQSWDTNFSFSITSTSEFVMTSKVDRY